MNDLTWNKIFAGFLISLIVIKLSMMISESIISPHSLDKPSYIIDTSNFKTTNSMPTAEVKIADILPFLEKGSIENGEKIFKKCMQCHTVSKSGMHKIGPNLWDIVLNGYAHAKDFSYSKAMKEEQGKKHWTYEDLNHFLYNPKKFIEGTKMSFVGIKDDQDRADVILYLREQSDAKKPLS